MNASADHHYVPRGYLKRWATAPDRLLCRFQWNRAGLSDLRVAPAATGYVKGLYSSKYDPTLGDRLEREFMQRVDGQASKILDLFNSSSGSEINLTAAERDGWARFIMCFLYRAPAQIEELKTRFAEILSRAPHEVLPENSDAYAATRKPHEPETLEEYLRAYFAVPKPEDVETATLKLVAQLSNSERIGTLINRMVQKVVSIHHSRHELLTSDRPLVTSGALGNPDAFLLLAISPRRIWLACHSELRMAQILVPDQALLVKQHNASVCENAERYVYGTTSAQKSFVRKYFPKPQHL